MHGLEQVPKGVMRKPVNVKWQKIAKMFTKVLYKTAKILQHHDFALLSKHINHVKILCRFSKVEDTYVYLWYIFHFKKN